MKFIRSSLALIFFLVLQELLRKHGSPIRAWRPFRNT